MFRDCIQGTYIGGNRNQQAAACKRFRPEFRHLEDEYFADDFRTIERVVQYADAWNEFCEVGLEILVNSGSLHYSRGGIKYLVEPLIRYFEKFTSNIGWIGDTDDGDVRVMEAFSHFSYHQSGGQLLVCDLQGRYKYNRFNRSKSRFELTDPAICSRRRSYGLTDMGEKGIDMFFYNHTCNEYCEDHWQRPRHVRAWFTATSSGTSMMSSQMSHKLRLNNPTTFGLSANNTIVEEDSYDSDDSYY